MQYPNLGTITGTTGGTLMAIAGSHTTSLNETMIIAAIGAAVSFAVTKLLKWLWERFRNLFIHH